MSEPNEVLKVEFEKKLAYYHELIRRAAFVRGNRIYDHEDVEQEAKLHLWNHTVERGRLPSDAEIQKLWKAIVVRTRMRFYRWARRLELEKEHGSKLGPRPRLKSDLVSRMDRVLTGVTREVFRQMILEEKHYAIREKLGLSRYEFSRAVEAVRNAIKKELM